MITRYFVTEENTLSYLSDGSLAVDGHIMPFALACKIGGHHWQDGAYIVSNDKARPATLADFETFRCVPPKGIIFGTGETYVNHGS